MGVPSTDTQHVSAPERPCALASEFQRGRSCTLRAANCGCEHRSAGGAAHALGGSRITFDFNATALTFGAKVIGTLMGWLVKNACAKAVRQDLLELKAPAEQATPASPAVTLRAHGDSPAARDSVSLKDRLPHCRRSADRARHPPARPPRRTPLRAQSRPQTPG